MIADSWNWELNHLYHCVRSRKNKNNESRFLRSQLTSSRDGDPFPIRILSLPPLTQSPSALLCCGGRVRIKDNLRILIRLLSHTSASCQATRKKQAGSTARASLKILQVTYLTAILQSCVEMFLLRCNKHRQSF